VKKFCKKVVDEFDHSQKAATDSWCRWKFFIFEISAIRVICGQAKQICRFTVLSKSWSHNLFTTGYSGLNYR